MNDFIKFYREKENLWDCSLDVAEWFSKIHPLQERKNLIINILIEKINAFDNKFKIVLTIIIIYVDLILNIKI